MIVLKPNRTVANREKAPALLMRWNATAEHNMQDEMNGIPLTEKSISAPSAMLKGMDCVSDTSDCTTAESLPTITSRSAPIRDLEPWAFCSAASVPKTTIVLTSS